MGEFVLMKQRVIFPKKKKLKRCQQINKSQVTNLIGLSMSHTHTHFGAVSLEETSVHKICGRRIPISIENTNLRLLYLCKMDMS